MIDIQRICNDFTKLVSFDSVSFSERKTADWLIKELKLLGFETKEDNAGQRYGGNAGNIYGFLKGEIPGTPILLSAHMDVVQPGTGKRAVIGDDNVITSAGDTVLGADDISGIVEILEGIRYLKRAHIAHRDIEVLFTIGEEAYAKGAAVFDYSVIQAKEAYVLDLSGPIGTAAIAAPSIISFSITIHGKAAHAGFEPENGIHAITAMSRFIQSVKQGHIDDETTLNIGMISGGVATNIVPDTCSCTGEIRSYRHEKALDCIENLKKVLNELAVSAGIKADMDTEIHLKAYSVSKTDDVVLRFQSACKQIGIKGKTTATFGGSDNNYFVNKGISGIVLSCGMYQVHSVKEYTRINDLENGARLIAVLMCQK